MSQNVDHTHREVSPATSVNIDICAKICDNGHAASRFRITRTKAREAFFRNDPAFELPLVFRTFYPTHLGRFDLCLRDRELNAHRRGNLLWGGRAGPTFLNTPTGGDSYCGDQVWYIAGKYEKGDGYSRSGIPRKPNPD